MLHFVSFPFFSLGFSLVYFGLFISLCGFHIWAFLLIFVALYFLFLVDSLWSRNGFHFFSFVGGSGVLSHRAYSGDILFFVGSLLQRRKIHSDFVGLTSPRGGKGPYFSFLTLRPGLLLCSDLSFFCNHGIQQHTHTHTHDTHDNTHPFSAPPPPFVGTLQLPTSGAHIFPVGDLFLTLFDATDAS